MLQTPAKGTRQQQIAFAVLQKIKKAIYRNEPIPKGLLNYLKNFKGDKNGS